MKLMRKTISVILAILICFCGCSLGFAEEEKAEVEKKVPMYASEMDLVKEFGFITEDNVENFDKNVTSVEFAKIMLKLMKIDFSDKADSEEIIKKAVEAQCFRGYLGTGYGPETEITIEQAATSIISALGYSRYCEYQGGYPDGYMRNANSKGILKAIKAQNKDIATMEQVVNMLYNSFEVPYMSQTIYGGKDTFSVDENKTILTEIHHIYIHEGIITANDATGLYDSSKKAQKNSVMIDKTNYNVGNTEISKLLGHRVKAYYFSDGNADAKIVAFLLKKSSDSREILATDLSVDDAKYTVTNIVYSDGKKSNINAKLMPDAAIIYNGVAHPDFNLATLKPKTGRIVLVDNNDDSTYDVVMVWEYIDYWVKDFDLKTYEMRDFYDNKLIIDPSDTGKKIDIYNADGTRTVMLDIKYDKVISVAKSIDESYMKVIINDKKISGTIEAVNKNEGYITINKEKYKVSPAYEKLEDRYKKVVEPGLVGTFYFNFDGQIIVIDTNNDNTILAGFVINGGVVKSGLDKTYGLKMLTENNAVEMLNLEDKVIIDGSSSKKSAEEAVKKFTENIGGNVGFQKKLILYKVNKAGNITAIDFPQTKESTIDPREDSLYINFRKEKKRKMMYRSGPKSFEAFAYIDQKVKVFKVGPLDNQNQMAEIDDEDYVFGGESMFQDQYTYTIDTFTNTREGLMSNYVILYPQSAGDAIPKIPRFLVFEDLVKGLDEKGNEILKVSGFVAGQKINYTVKDSSSAAKLLETGTVKPGDTLVFGTDEKNRLTALELVYDMANNVFFPNNPSDGVSTDYTMMYAIPLKERDGLYEVEVTSKNGDSAIYMYKPASFSVLVYDKNEKHNKAYKGSPSDIVTKEQSPDNYSRLLLSTTWAVPSDMIVYK